MVTTLGLCVNWPSHTRVRAYHHYTSSTLIGGNLELVQVRFALQLRDKHSQWMQDGCKVYMDSHVAWMDWIVHGCMLCTLHGRNEGQYEVASLMALEPVTLWARALLHHGEWFNVAKCWQLGDIYMCWFPIGVDFSISTLHLRVRDHTTWFWKCIRMTFKHFFRALTITQLESTVIFSMWHYPIWTHGARWLPRRIAPQRHSNG